VLTGARVRLRAIEREDLPALHEIDNDIEVRSLVSARSPVPESLAELEARFAAGAANPQPGQIRFAIEADGAVIGDCGLHTMDNYSLNCHLGIAIRRDLWGQGYGTDAVRLLVDYAFSYLRMHKVCLEVLAHDARAVRAYEKAGFVAEGRFREHSWHRGAYRDLLRMAVFNGDRP